MKIKSLHIKNLRCFDDFEIKFHDRLTVLVGVNGAGKTFHLTFTMSLAPYNKPLKITNSAQVL